MEAAKIVIIGCGMSGVAAAHKLVKAGFQNVRILEATARSGGRVKTGRLGEHLCNSQRLTAASTSIPFVCHFVLPQRSYSC